MGTNCSEQVRKCEAYKWRGVWTALTYLIAYLLTPWIRVILEKLTGLQLVKKFLAFYATRELITQFEIDRHLSLS
jgi:hypothetical protein